MVRWGQAVNSSVDTYLSGLPCLRVASGKQQQENKEAEKIGLSQQVSFCPQRRLLSSQEDVVCPP